MIFCDVGPLRVLIEHGFVVWCSFLGSEWGLVGLMLHHWSGGETPAGKGITNLPLNLRCHRNQTDNVSLPAHRHKWTLQCHFSHRLSARESEMIHLALHMEEPNFDRTVLSVFTTFNLYSNVGNTVGMSDQYWSYKLYISNIMCYTLNGRMCWDFEKVCCEKQAEVEVMNCNCSRY